MATPFTALTASIARIANYLDGGKDNFAPDRLVGDSIVRVFPDVGVSVRAQVAFGLHAARSMAAAGIDQFLELGCGMPPVCGPYLHEVLRAVHRSAAVIYVSDEELVVVHRRALMAVDDDEPPVVHQLSELTDVQLLGRLAAAQALDLHRPVGVLLTSSLQHLDVDAPWFVRQLMTPVAAGSRLALAHWSRDRLAPAAAEVLCGSYARANLPLVLRSRDELRAVVLDAELEPTQDGIVPVDRWRPEQTPAGGSCGVYGLPAGTPAPDP